MKYNALIPGKTRFQPYLPFCFAFYRDSLKYHQILNGGLKDWAKDFYLAIQRDTKFKKIYTIIIINIY